MIAKARGLVLALVPALIALAGSEKTSGQGMMTVGPPQVPTTRMVQRFNPVTRQYEWVGVPSGAIVNPYPGGGYGAPPTSLDPYTGLYPFPNTRPPGSTGPYPSYPYMMPNPYPGGNLGALPSPAGGQVAQRQVSEWYGRYLRRQVDQAGMYAHVRAYQSGGPEAALSGVLGSQEYYRLWGNDPRRFVTGLYSDILHRQPRPDELNVWAVQVGRKTLTQVAFDFLQAARRELGGPYY